MSYSQKTDSCGLGRRWGAFLVGITMFLEVLSKKAIAVFTNCSFILKAEKAESLCEKAPQKLFKSRSHLVFCVELKAVDNHYTQSLKCAVSTTTDVYLPVYHHVTFNCRITDQNSFFTPLFVQLSSTLYKHT